MSNPIKKQCPVSPSLSLCQFTNSHLSSAKSTKSQTIISTTWKQSEPVYKSKAVQSLLLSPISPQHRPGEWSQILSFNTLKVWGVKQIIFLLNTECQPLSDCNQRYLICMISYWAISDGSASMASEKDQSEEHLHSVTSVCWLSLLSSLCIYFSSEVLFYHTSICQFLQQWSNYFKREASSCAGVLCVDCSDRRAQRIAWLKSRKLKLSSSLWPQTSFNSVKTQQSSSQFKRQRGPQTLGRLCASVRAPLDSYMESVEENHLKRCKGRNAETEQEQRHSARNH